MKRKQAAFLALTVILVGVASFFLWRETHSTSSNHTTVPHPSTHSSSNHTTVPHPSNPSTNKPVGSYTFLTTDSPSKLQLITSATECGKALLSLGRADSVAIENNPHLPSGCVSFETNKPPRAVGGFYNSYVDAPTRCTHHALCVIKK